MILRTRFSLRPEALPLRLLLAIGLVAGCGGGTSDTAQAPVAPAPEAAASASGAAELVSPVQGGELIIARSADGQTLDPADAFDGESSKVVDQIFEGLVSFVPGSTDIKPALAASWESSEDARTWTFQLRQGVRFHDGTPFDAEAVVFSLERQMNPDHPFHNGDFNTWHSTFERHVAGVRALDTHTVEIRLHEPFAPILSGFAVQSLAIVSPTAMREHGKAWFDRNGVGTGPFRLLEWIPQERVVLAANDDYWGGRPHLDRVTFRVVPDTAQRAALLEAGEVQMAEDLDNASIRRLAALDSVKVSKRPGLSTAYLALNTTRAPFTDSRVRQAVALALDLPARVRATYEDLGVPAKNYLPPVLWGYNDAVPAFPFDPDEARRLLAAAGAEGASFTLDVMATPRPYLPEPLEIAESIQARLQEIGLTVTLRINPWSDHIERLIRSPEADYDACLLGWVADMPDPNDFLFVQFHSSNADLSRPHRNMALYRNPEVDGLVERAQRITDREERATLYRRVQEIVHQDVPIVPIAHSFMVLVHDARVQNLSVPVAVSNYGLERAWLAGDAGP